jgi:hypothetical protein
MSDLGRPRRANLLTSIQKRAFEVVLFILKWRTYVDPINASLARKYLLIVYKNLTGEDYHG